MIIKGIIVANKCSIQLFDKSIVNDLLNMIEKYNPFGIILVGSSSMQYKDSKSDYDFEVIIDDYLYSNLNNDDIFVKKYEITDRPIEYLLRSYSAFNAKIDAPNDIDHWSYQNACIIYDTDEYMRKTVEKIAYIDSEKIINRLKIHYFDFLFFIKHLERINENGNKLNYSLSLNSAIISLIKILSLVNGKWPPAMHWAFQNIELLGQESIEIINKISLLEEAFSSKTVEDVIKDTDKFLSAHMYSFQYEKKYLTAEICSDKLNEERYKYSLL